MSCVSVVWMYVDSPHPRRACGRGTCDWCRTSRGPDWLRSPSSDTASNSLLMWRWWGARGPPHHTVRPRLAEWTPSMRASCTNTHGYTSTFQKLPIKQWLTTGSPPVLELIMTSSNRDTDRTDSSIRTLYKHIANITHIFFLLSSKLSFSFFILFLKNTLQQTI